MIKLAEIAETLGLKQQQSAPQQPQGVAETPYQ
jgi:hypothetical protein